VAPGKYRIARPAFNQPVVDERRRNSPRPIRQPRRREVVQLDPSGDSPPAPAELTADRGEANQDATWGVCGAGL